MFLFFDAHSEAYFCTDGYKDVTNLQYLYNTICRKALAHLHITSGRPAQPMRPMTRSSWRTVTVLMLTTEEVWSFCYTNFS